MSDETCRAAAPTPGEAVAASAGFPGGAVRVLLGPLLFQSSSDRDYLRNSDRLYRECGVDSKDTVALTASGRFVTCWDDLVRATVESDCPIYIFKPRAES